MSDADDKLEILQLKLEIREVMLGVAAMRVEVDNMTTGNPARFKRPKPVKIPEPTFPSLEVVPPPVSKLKSILYWSIYGKTWRERYHEL